LGVFAGGLYFKVGLTIAGFQNRVGSLFFLGSLIAFSSLRCVVSPFCQMMAGEIVEKKVY